MDRSGIAGYQVLKILQMIRVKNQKETNIEINSEGRSDLISFIKLMIAYECGFSMDTYQANYDAELQSNSKITLYMVSTDSSIRNKKKSIIHYVRTSVGSLKQCVYCAEFPNEGTHQIKIKSLWRSVEGGGQKLIMQLWTYIYIDFILF